ncbi:unnamed protein product [Macrosiphum euphorbiae]|uniref:Uncharacterized protein n=1 Tax=Macrosiphum euphorbiae TaxID=13131 RepID=A0AAV0XUI0_9HEMI|nr:unnamed protein product [Macrosiphum euphorbiae]
MLKSPGKFAKKYSNNIDRIRSNTTMRRRKLFAAGVVRSKPKTKSSAPDKDYGLAEPLDDLFSLSPEAFAEKKPRF